MKIKDFIEEDKHTGSLGSYRIVDGDIAVGMATKDGSLTTEMIDMQVQQILDTMGVKQYYSVFDIGTVLWVSSDARNWVYSEMAARTVKGYAIVAETPIASMIADIWVKLVNLPFPVKKFKHCKDGLDWIRELKAKEARKTPTGHH